LGAQAMLKDGFKPNIFIYNSMMNINVGDLDEVQHYYQHMQVAILNSVNLISENEIAFL
jgi:hypothetical protein